MLNMSYLKVNNNTLNSRYDIDELGVRYWQLRIDVFFREIVME